MLAFRVRHTLPQSFPKRETENPLGSCAFSSDEKSELQEPVSGSLAPFLAYRAFLLFPYALARLCHGIAEKK
jgi:hypothetical protein